MSTLMVVGVLREFVVISFEGSLSLPVLDFSPFDTPHHISISLCLRVSLSSTSLRSFDTVQKYKSTSSLLSTFVYHLSFFLFLSLSFSPHLPQLHSSSCLSAATHSSKANQCKLCVCLTHHVRVQFELVGFDC